MPRELKTERELLELVVQALDANTVTAGWIPTGFHETVEADQARPRTTGPLLRSFPVRPLREAAALYGKLRA
ncbi:hypothetical protein PQR02_36280 [Paraburkholderia sediminicola]|uniref:Uncharacterized protein n=1 Tax=Paraburkholderia rhynchosiae TaxID=487049 RepID=A0ACC7NKU2_9BURK